MTLTDDDLFLLTGYRRPSKQIEWLKRNRWVFVVNAVGHPRVATAYYNMKMGVDRAQAAIVQPNWEAA